MSNQTSTTPARYGSATTVRTGNAKCVGRIREHRIQMLVLAATICASMAGCGNGPTKPANPPPMPVAQTRAAVAPATPPTPTASRPSHATVTGPRLYN
jgi:hypothetical protein